LPQIVPGVETIPNPERETVVGELDAELEKLMLPVALAATVGAKSAVNEALCPAARVNGRLSPLTEKPVPVTFADDIVTLPLDAVRVADRLPVLPTPTFPKASELELEFSKGVTPVPERERAVGELDAELEKLTLPLALPATVGAKATVNEVLCPAARVNGKLSPLIEKPLPATLAEDIVTLPCDAVRVPDELPVLPTRTLPKASELELEFSNGVTPVPERETAVGELDAELEKLILPLALPAAVGAKATVNEVLCPAARVNGRLKPLME
jgi:hypothetical protein